jgi:hypothetical protein
MKKLLLYGFALSLLAPVTSEATPNAVKTQVSVKSESLFKKKRRYKAKRKGGFMGLFGKKNNGCGCPKY